ncbi:MAG TPA: dihydrofolate reductase [Verrucomicrobiales bacterium]|nr:dihydrofolate reductase [Verrucomicrobiae bacterium]MCP5554115.1 dihydrofolate reductase [Akkermansiaceae bacterium]HRX56259.1 dihydrofolate reductase [Verrucomicrobiales bacterium]
MKDSLLPEVVLIAAMDRHRVIGGPDGGIPWHLPDDVAHFRAAAKGRHLLLGRRTFEEMQGWFTDQIPLVLTRQEEYRVPGGVRVSDVTEAIARVVSAGQNLLLVAGGATVFAATIAMADRLLLTLVDTDVSEGLSSVQSDSLPRFPDPAAFGDWRETSRIERPEDERHVYARTFLELTRC